MTSLGFLTIRDGAGKSRWILTAVLAGAAIGLAGSTFLGGVVFSQTSTFSKLKTEVQARLNPEAVDPATLWAVSNKNELAPVWRKLETNNRTLDYISIPIGEFSGSGGSIVEIGTNLMFVTPKGRIGYLADIETGDTTEILYLAPRVPIRLPEFEQSDIAKMPRFNRNWVRTLDSMVLPAGDNVFDLYVSHHRYDDECFSLAVSRTKVVLTRTGLEMPIETWEPVFAAKPCVAVKEFGNLYSGLRDGGRMHMSPEGKLLLTVGDFDFDADNSPINAPMSPDYDLGKLIEIDLATGQGAPYAIGMRNPQGLDVTEDGLIFTSEHGPNGGDEINVIKRGANYGWPVVTLGMAYGFPRRDWLANPVQGRHDVDGYTSPVFAFVPSIGIGSITEITSDLFPEWRGDLWVTSLENQGLWRLRRNGEEIIYAERTQIGERMRDIAQLQNGQFAMLTDSAKVILLRPGKPSLEVAASAGAERLKVGGYAEVREVAAQDRRTFASLGLHPGRLAFEAKCATCHAIDSTETLAGPSLLKLAGRKVGGVAGFAYSEALTERGETWTEQRIRLFLSDPAAEFAGTAMPQVPMTLPEYLHVPWWITNCTGGRDRPECHKGD